MPPPDSLEYTISRKLLLQFLHPYKMSPDHRANMVAVPKKPEAPVRTNITVSTSLLSLQSNHRNWRSIPSYHVKKTAKGSPCWTWVFLTQFLSAYVRQQVLHPYRTSQDPLIWETQGTSPRVLTSAATMASLVFFHFASELQRVFDEEKSDQ
jgi:hypothetical protein